MIKVGDEVVLPEYLGGGLVKVIIVELPVSGMMQLRGRNLIGVELQAMEKYRGQPTGRTTSKYLMVPLEDVTRTPCPTCGASR